MTVIWQNWDGTQLQSKTYYKSGTEPSYSGSTPTRPDDNYRYTFSGWTLVSSSDPYTKIYQAQYTSVSKITVTWKNWDNSVLQTKTYFGGDPEPTYSGSTPTRPDNIPSSGNGTRYTFSGWNLVSSSTFAKNYQAKFNTTTLYVWNRYTVVEGSTYTSKSLYSHYWSDEDSWDPGNATISGVNNQNFEYCVQYQMSSNTSNTFRSDVLNSAWDASTKTFNINNISYDIKTGKSVSHGGNHNGSRDYTDFFIWGTLSHVNEYPGDSNGYIYINPSSPTSPSLIHLHTGCWPQSSKYSNYSTTVTEYLVGKEMGTYIDYVISTSSSAYPSSGEHTDGYWYVKR